VTTGEISYNPQNIPKKPISMRIAVQRKSNRIGQVWRLRLPVSPGMMFSSTSIHYAKRAATLADAETDIINVLMYEAEGVAGYPAEKTGCQHSD
jgi:hypothetical protein